MCILYIYSVYIQCIFIYIQMPTCSFASVMYNSLQPHGLQLARLLCPWGFSRQEYQSGLPRSPLEDLPDPGTKQGSPALQADSLPLSHRGSPMYSNIYVYINIAILSKSKPITNTNLLYFYNR